MTIRRSSMCGGQTGERDLRPGAAPLSAVRQSPPLGALRQSPPPLASSCSFHPPPAPVATFRSRCSTACSWCRALSSRRCGLRTCIKLQNPPRWHSFVSCCRQHASRKSVTGDSSAKRGRPGVGEMGIGWSMPSKDVSACSSPSQLQAAKPTFLSLPLTVVPLVIERIDRALRLVLSIEARIDIADQVLADIVAHMHLHHGAELG